MEQAQAIDNTELSIVSEMQLRSITELTCLAREPGRSRAGCVFQAGVLLQRQIPLAVTTTGVECR